ncbi:helix-turn-helix transcriptional regulator [Streptomyces sp. AV19]|uniref:helix-turn-helix domain-containing protein n=1 Tax=Streptomyces sp. AV19 TaxID=2793068 RepID=UPI0024136225|nr:helix-turn-helix transcriptional regulator [Streptomyces sp. AV19]MDG4532155.1 helix-turn-helix transcriptional regulator [Streptomyces sp. AV19]
MKLRALRDQRGWSQAKLAGKVFLSHARIAQFESGESMPSQRHAQALDEALGAGGALLDEWDKLNDSPDAKWAQKLVGVEAKALEIRHFSDLVPALLQTEGYARAILAESMEFYGGDLEAKMRYRIQRRALLDRPDAPTFMGLLKESALSWVVGGTGVMREQLLDLLRMARKSHVSIQVVPFVGPRFLSDVGMLTITRLPGGREVVYRGGVQGAWVTNRAAIAEYAVLYERVQRGALSPCDSMTLIDKVLGEKYP